MLASSTRSVISIIFRVDEPLHAGHVLPGVGIGIIYCPKVCGPVNLIAERCELLPQFAPLLGVCKKLPEQRAVVHVGFKCRYSFLVVALEHPKFIFEPGAFSIAGVALADGGQQPFHQFGRTIVALSHVAPSVSVVRRHKNALPVFVD